MLNFSETMSKTDYAKCSIFLNIAFSILFINLCASAPLNVTENAYTHFIAELNRDKCSLPSQVQLPFDNTKVNNFEYLSSYLEICQKTESAKRNKEAVILCNEIFNSLKNISCSTEIALPDISVKLSQKVCEDISDFKDSVPKDDKTLLKRLTDSFLCDIMCDSEFEKACQLLLWSFEVQRLIASVAHPQKPEQTVIPEDEGKITEHFKQDVTADEEHSKKGQQKTEESKNLNGVVGHSDMTEIPGTFEAKDNPEQKPDETANTDKKGNQGKVASSNKFVLENQTVPKTGIQNLAETSKSSSNLKPSGTLSEQASVTSISNTEVSLIGEGTKSESNGQNPNEIIQDMVVNVLVAKHAEQSLSKGSIGNVATDEQALSVTASVIDNKPDKNFNDMLPNKQPQENSNNRSNLEVSVNDVDGPKEITDEAPQKPDQNSLLSENNQFPQESVDEQKPNDASSDFYNNAQNPSNHVDALAQNKVQSNNEELAVKTDASTTGNQINKETILQQVTQEVATTETSLAREENKADHSQTNSVLPTQDQGKSGDTTHDLIDDKTPNLDQKQPKVSPQTEKFDNTSPDILAKDKLPETNQKSKATAANPDVKNVVPSSVTESSTKNTVAIEKMESDSDLRQPVDEEGDHYADIENTEDDYSRPDYGGGLYEGSKTKETNPDVPSPAVVSKEIMTSQNEKPIEFPSRNSFGQDSSDMMIGFPEQEDSHFFFYFLSIVLILMAGYLIFHNKQKIIALIVEGRHERNRRSHRVGYKKLETK